MAPSTALARLRGLLAAHTYQEASDAAPGDDELRLRKAPAGSPLRALLTLFSSEHRLTHSEATNLLSEPVLAELVARELLVRDGDTFAGAFRISGADGLFLAHDPSPPARPDYVGGVNPAARTLASLTIRRPVDTALDLCAGSGYQAMLLARHASRVIATDLLPRSIWLTRLNAELNGIENMECREGNLFAPVEGETFDLIACNPPFIISPDVTYSFRDGGGHGDSLSEAVVRGVAGRLTDGGTAAMLVNWGLAAGEDWSLPAERWLDDSGCDAVLLRYGTTDPVDYAALWNAPLAHQGLSEYRRTLERWPSYLAERGFERVVHAGVVLRKRAGSNELARFDAMGPEGDATGQLERMLARVPRSTAHEEADERLQLIAGHRLEQRMTFEGGAYRIDPARLSLAMHAGVVGTVPAELVPFLMALPGGETVRGVALEIAGQMGVEPGEYLRSATQLVVELLDRGLLEEVRDD